MSPSKKMTYKGTLRQVVHGRVKKFRKKGGKGSPPSLKYHRKMSIARAKLSYEQLNTFSHTFSRPCFDVKYIYNPGKW